MNNVWYWLAGVAPIVCYILGYEVARAKYQDLYHKGRQTERAEWEAQFGKVAYVLNGRMVLESELEEGEDGADYMACYSKGVYMGKDGSLTVQPPDGTKEEPVGYILTVKP